MLYSGQKDSVSSDLEFIRDELEKNAINSGIKELAGELISDGAAPGVDFLFETKGVKEQTKQLREAALKIQSSNLSEEEKMRRLQILHNADCFRAVMLGLKLVPTVIGIGVAIFFPGAAAIYALGALVVSYILGNIASTMFDNYLNNALYCDLRWSIDPSGYVYEGIQSNRLSGVQTTIYYKNSNGEMSLWDASEYEQLNPIETNQEGIYAWDVPEGEWRVKFEKGGYETTFSEWLPVPPVQTEVNVGMISLNPPHVSTCEIYDKYAVLTFDQYIKVDSITKDSIHIYKDNQEGVAFSITPVNPVKEEESLLTEQFRFDYDSMIFSGALTLTADRNIKNYADTKMEDVYSLTNNIIPAIEGLNVDIPEKNTVGEHLQFLI